MEWVVVMPRVKLPVTDGLYISQDPENVDKRSVNLYPVIEQSQARSSQALYNTPGSELFSMVATSGSRGSILDRDAIPFFVIGGALYSFDRLGNDTNHGTIDGVNDVSMASNGINIVIVVPDGSIYFFDLDTQVLSSRPNPPPEVDENGTALTVTFKDTYYVYSSQTVISSGSNKDTNDGKDFDPLDFEDAEFQTDIITKVFNNLNQLYVFGINTIEIYQTIVTSGFPFSRVTGGTIEIGCRAPNTVVSFNGGMAFVGGSANQRPGVYTGIGSSFQKISTSSVDQLLQKYTDQELFDARAFVYSQNGNSFLVITIGDNTLVYDSTTSSLAGRSIWHERQSGVTSALGFQAWNASHGLLAYGKILVGDPAGKVGSLDFGCKTEYGETVERFFTTQPFINDVQSTFAYEIELDMQTGVGLINEVEPKILMSYSDDGGNLFNNEVPRGFGKVGEYSKRVRWSRGGRFPVSRTYLFRTTDPVSVNIYGMYANAEVYVSG